MTSRHIKDIVKLRLADELDSLMTSHGFSRGKSSAIYRRRIAQATQEHEIALEYRPDWAPTCYGYLVAFQRVSLDEVTPVIRKIWPFVTPTSDPPAWALSSPIGFCIPMDREEPKLIKSDKDIGQSVVGIRRDVETWIISHFEKYVTAKDLCKGYENADVCMGGRGRNDFLFVAAAYVANSNARKGLEVLERHFGKPGARRNYEVAFNYVRSCINGGQINGAGPTGNERHRHY